MSRRRLYARFPGASCILALIIAVLIAPAALVWSADDSGLITVDAEGSGAMGKLNISQAREYAIEDGLAKAFKSALQSLLPPDISPLKFREAWQALYADRGQYVVKYGITGESFDADTERVTIRATFAGNLLVEKLRSLGYESVRFDRTEKDLTLTVGDVRSYEEYAGLRDFLKRHISCVQEVIPSRLSWREVSFRLTLQGKTGCVTEVEGPFIVKETTDGAIEGVLRRLK